GPDRRAVGPGRAAVARAETWWPVRKAPETVHRGRYLVRGQDRLCLAVPASGFHRTPWQTVYWYFSRWERDKVTDTMLAALREQPRVQQGRNPQPSAGIIDSQSVKRADTVGRDTRGYDAAKRTNGRKRFIVTDTLGLLVAVVVLAASVQDRDGDKTTLLSM